MALLGPPRPLLGAALADLIKKSVLVVDLGSAGLPSRRWPPPDQLQVYRSTTLLGEEEIADALLTTDDG